jgi:hypothetical protein
MVYTICTRSFRATLKTLTNDKRLLVNAPIFNVVVNVNNIFEIENVRVLPKTKMLWAY